MTTTHVEHVSIAISHSLLVNFEKLRLRVVRSLILLLLVPPSWSCACGGLFPDSWCRPFWVFRPPRPPLHAFQAFVQCHTDARESAGNYRACRRSSDAKSRPEGEDCSLPVICRTLRSDIPDVHSGCTAEPKGNSS